MIEGRTETRKHTFGDLLKQNMLEKEHEWKRVSKELSAGINVSKKLIEISRAREEMEVARRLFLEYETGELKCPFERISAEGRQLLQKYIDSVSVKVFPIPSKEDESNFEYLTRTNTVFEKFFMETWDFVKELRKRLEGG